MGSVTTQGGSPGLSQARSVRITNGIRSAGARTRSGFTLIEILVVIGIIAILAAIVIIAINPSRQFAQARESQRVSNVNAILNAIGQDIADNRGLFACPAYPTLAATAAAISGTAANIRSCLVPTYLPELPFDPVGGSNTCASGDAACTTYDTKYTLAQDVAGRITVCAPGGVEPAIAGSAAICVTR